MNEVIDNIETTTGWSASGGATIYGLNTFEEFRAGNTDASLIVSFNGLNGYVQKTYSVDVSDYSNFVIWVSSRDKGTKDYRTIDNYVYKIELADSKEYYLPVMKDFYWVSINISDISTLQKIKITALHSDLDYLVLNYALVVEDDFPLDLLNGIKDELEYIRDTFYSFKSIGTISGTTGDAYIEFSSSVEYLDRYSVIKISEGANDEIHHISSVEGNKFYFGELFDGSTLLNDYTTGLVELYYPVIFGTTQEEILLPAISIWGFESERQLLDSELDHIIDTVKTDDTFEERQVGQYLLWDILIDCESKEEWETMDEMAKIVRNFIGKRTVWINGRKCNIELTTKPTEMYPTDAYDIIPKIQYPINVSLREELYAPSVLPKTSILDISVTIE